MLKTLLNNISKISPLLIAGAFLLSLIHEIGYLWFLNLEPLDIYAFKDYVSLSLRWLIPTILYAGLGFPISVFLYGITKKTTKDSKKENLADRTYLQLLKNMYWCEMTIYAGTMIFTVATFLLEGWGDAFPFLIMTIYMFGMAISLKLLIKDAIDNLAAFRFAFFFSALMLSFINGLTDFQKLEKQGETDNLVTLYLSNNQKVTAPLLRIIDKGLLLYDVRDSSFMLYPWASISSYRRLNHRMAKTSGCKRFPVLSGLCS